jgi:predicted ATP-dependent Lon-type protease
MKEDSRTIRKVKSVLKRNKLKPAEAKKVLKLVINEISLNRKIDRLQTMQNLFKYWHVAHLPFALVMLIIMVIHVIVTIVFGYRWIF